MKPFALLALSAAALAACGPPGAGANGQAAAAPPGPPVVIGPLPPPPPWSLIYLGRGLAEVLPPPQAACAGHIDGVMRRFAGPPAGVQLVGWAWDKAGKRPVERVILTDRSGKVIGGGDSGLDRPDVPKALPEITAANTGWTAHALIGSGEVTVYGVMDGGRTLCALGVIPS